MNHIVIFSLILENNVSLIPFIFIISFMSLNLPFLVLYSIINFALDSPIPFNLINSFIVAVFIFIFDVV